MNKKQNTINFWQIKHQIDDEVKRLGWSVDYCKEYIQKHYGKRSRLVMSDSELTQLLAKLRTIKTSGNTNKVSRKRKLRRRR